MIKCLKALIPPCFNKICQSDTIEVPAFATNLTSRGFFKIRGVRIEGCKSQWKSGTFIFVIKNTHFSFVGEALWEMGTQQFERNLTHSY